MVSGASESATRSSQKGPPSPHTRPAQVLEGQPHSWPLGGDVSERAQRASQKKGGEANAGRGHVFATIRPCIQKRRVIGQSSRRSCFWRHKEGSSCAVRGRQSPTIIVLLPT